MSFIRHNLKYVVAKHDSLFCMIWGTWISVVGYSMYSTWFFDGCFCGCSTLHSVQLLKYRPFRQTSHMPYHVLLYDEHDSDVTFSWKWLEHDLTIWQKCVINQQSVVGYGMSSTWFSTVVFSDGVHFPSVMLLKYVSFRQTLHMPHHVLSYAEHDGDLTFSWKQYEHVLTTGSKCVVKISNLL